MPKKTNIEKKRVIFTNLLRTVKKQMRPVIEFCEKLSPKKLVAIPWNIRRAMEQIKTSARRYLLDVAHFTRTNTMKKGKILSLFARAVAYIDKKKVGKSAQFGRIFQLGRIKGSFLFVLASNSVLMNDKLSLAPLLAEHQRLFGEGVLCSVATDKGYWSAKNKKYINETSGIQEKWSSASCQYQKQDWSAKPRSSGPAQGPPCWNRTINWSRKTGGTIKKKQDEKRCSNVSCWLRVCFGLQYEENYANTRASDTKGSMKKKQFRVDLFEILRRSGSGYAAGMRNRCAEAACSFAPATIYLVACI